MHQTLCPSVNHNDNHVNKWNNQDYNVSHITEHDEDDNDNANPNHDNYHTHHHNNNNNNTSNNNNNNNTNTNTNNNRNRNRNHNHNHNLQLDAVRAGSARGGQVPHGLFEELASTVKPCLSRQHDEEPY